MNEYRMIAKTFKGLEDVLAEELIEIGANNVEIQRRAVYFTGSKETMYKANIHLRTASRVLKPIKEFKAKDTDEIYNALKKIAWDKIMDVKTTFAIDATVYSDFFRHSQFVAYRVKDSIVDFFREKENARPSVSLDNPMIRINIHIAQNLCTLSLDSSGDSLHKRGYRLDQNEAPLNEALAAGLILKSGWRGESDFIDPMCGSGTLLIEAALIAQNIPTGIFKEEFAFEKWKDFDSELFNELISDDSMEREFKYKIYGSDISKRAINITTQNAKRAGVLQNLTLEVKSISEQSKPSDGCIVITNPPYGERLNPDNLHEIYTDLGSMLKHRFTGCTAWVISSCKSCLDKIGLKTDTKIELLNGALESKYCKYTIFEGKRNDYLASKNNKSV